MHVLTKVIYTLVVQCIEPMKNALMYACFLIYDGAKYKTLYRNSKKIMLVGNFGNQNRTLFSFGNTVLPIVMPSQHIALMYCHELFCVLYSILLIAKQNNFVS